MRRVGCAGAKNALFSAREAILWIPGRTASKWKHGRGLPELARLLGAEAEELLRGNLRKNPPPGGNMKNSQALFLSALRRGGLLRSGNEAFLLRPHSYVPCAPGPGRGPRLSYRSPGRRMSGDAASPHEKGTSPCGGTACAVRTIFHALLLRKIAPALTRGGFLCYFGRDEFL